MSAIPEVLALLDEVLSLRGRALTFTAETPLLGALPELDSMAVVGLLAALEDRWGIELSDSDIDAHTFATVASFAAFVESQVPALARPAA